MDSLVGVGIVIAITLAVMYFIFVIVYVIIAAIITVITYLACGIYVGLDFIATNIFVALDKVFYPGFNAPPPAMWVFWGIVIGAAIQGYREMTIYGRKDLRVLIALAPVLLLAVVNLVKTLVD
jgi:hypothetical protein